MAKVRVELGSVQLWWAVCKMAEAGDWKVVIEMQNAKASRRKSTSQVLKSHLVMLNLTLREG